MDFKRFPDFGAELKRPFEVSEHCYDCVEFYGEGHGAVGCNAWPAGKPFRCADFFSLPVVGIDGATGQEFPPSRMKGRKEPRELPEQGKVRPASDEGGKGRRTRRDRTPSPAASLGPEAERKCVCGVELPKRRRCCDACRVQRRKETVQRWQDQRTAATPVDAASDMPFPGSGRPLTHVRSGCDN